MSNSHDIEGGIPLYVVKMCNTVGATLVLTVCAVIILQMAFAIRKTDGEFSVTSFSKSGLVFICVSLGFLSVLEVCHLLSNFYDMSRVAPILRLLLGVIFFVTAIKLNISTRAIIQKPKELPNVIYDASEVSLDKGVGSANGPPKRTGSVG